MPSVKIGPSPAVAPKLDTPPVDTGAKTATAGEAYVTKKGDTLWGMAQQAYGDGSQWTRIRDANTDKVTMRDQQTAIIGTGVRFEIPPERERTSGWQAKEKPSQGRERVTQPQAQKPQVAQQEAKAAPQQPPQPVEPPKPPPIDKKAAGEDATKLYNAMKGGLFGAGTDEDAVFKALEGKSPEQVGAIKSAYKDHYKRDLDYDIKDELSGKDLTRAQSLMKGDVGAADAVAVKQAIGTIYNDNDAIYRALDGKSPQQMQAMKDSYQRQFGEPLETALNKGMSGDKLERAKALMSGNKVAAEAAELSHAIRGAGTDEAAVMKVLGNKTPDQINALRTEFKKQGRNMDLEIENDLSGAELKQAKALLGGTAPERERKTTGANGAAPAGNKTDINRARADAAIVEGALGTFSNDYGAIDKALANKSPAQLDAIKDAFQASTGKSMETAFRENGMSPARLDHLMELAAGTGSSPAAQIRAAVQGAGTDEELIKTQLQGRSKKEIADISADYKTRYGEDLGTRLDSELSGRDAFDVKNMLQGVPETPSEGLALLNKRFDYERKGWTNAFAGGAIDLVSDSGKLLDRNVARANEFHDESIRSNKEAGLPEKLTPAQEQRLGELIGFGVGDVGGYREARDTAGEVAANVATTAAAVGVTVATGGLAAPIAAAGAARVLAKAAFAGESYTVGDGAKDFITGGVEGGLNAATLGSASALTAAKTAGNATAQAVSNVAGRVVSERAAVAIAQTTGRVVAGATEGAITGGISGGISSAVGRSIDDKTWNDGIAQGLGNVASSAVAGTVTGVGVGGVVGGAMNVTGKHVEIDKPVSRQAQVRAKYDETLGVKAAPGDAAHAAKQAELDEAFNGPKPKNLREQVDQELGVKKKPPTSQQHAAKQDELDEAFNGPKPKNLREQVDREMGVRKGPTSAEHAAKQSELDEVFQSRTPAQARAEIDQQLGVRKPPTRVDHAAKQAELDEVFQARTPAQARAEIDQQLGLRVKPTHAEHVSKQSELEFAFSARHGDDLTKAIGSEAKKAGYKAPELYAMENLKHPNEIAEFADGYLKKHPKIGLENMKYALGGGEMGVVPGTENAWRAAISRAEVATARTGDKLTGAIERGAKKAGYNAPEMYALENLKNPREIAEFAKGYAELYPHSAMENIKYAIKGGGNLNVAPGTEGAWRSALSKMSRGTDDALNSVEKLRGAGGLFKPENAGELRTMRQALDQLRGASGRLKPESPGEAKLGRDLLKFFGASNDSGEISRVVNGLKGPSGFNPGSRAEMGFLRGAYDKLKGTGSDLSRELGSFFQGRTTLMNEVGKMRDAAGRLLPFDKLPAPNLAKMKGAMEHLFTFGPSNPAEKALEKELVNHVAKHGGHVDMVHVSLMLLGHPHHGEHEEHAEHAIDHAGGEHNELGIDHEALLGKTLQMLDREGPQNAEEEALQRELRERFGN